MAVLIARLLMYTWPRRLAMLRHGQVTVPCGSRYAYNKCWRKINCFFFRSWLGLRDHSCHQRWYLNHIPSPKPSRCHFYPPYQSSVWTVSYRLNLHYPRFSLKRPFSLRYLVRMEAIALHVASTYGGAQFYISCGQVNVLNGGSGTPGPLVSIPGVYTGYVRIFPSKSSTRFSLIHHHHISISFW